MPKDYGKHHVNIHDDKTGEDYDFFENESAKEDPSKPGDTGDVVSVAGGLKKAAIWRAGDAHGRGEGDVPLREVECGHTYDVHREKLVDKGADTTCGGPKAFADEYALVKDEVQQLALTVADRCRRHPSCQAVIDFQSSHRGCFHNPNPDKWYMQLRYQVRVTCFTL